jgi:hypothetical protein
MIGTLKNSLTLSTAVFCVLMLPLSTNAQQAIVQSQNGSCPSGSSHVGSGYCRTTSGKGYVLEMRGSCPSGTSHAGAGYCVTDGRTLYVPENNGSCPSGTSHAGAGYCQGR